MPSAPHAPSVSHWIKAGFVERLLKPVARLLQTGDETATIDRLFSSQHVKDLQLIVGVAFATIALVFGVGLLLLLEEEIGWIFTNSGQPWLLLQSVHHLFGTGSTYLSFVVPAFAIFGAILTWAYQVGSARLGVVDLFACEISTLCRVITVVDVVRQQVEKFDRDPPAERSASGDHGTPSQQFTSQETYFPIFEGNARDLENLEARVVINITAFYTYMKAVRDALRALAETRLLAGDAEPASTPVLTPRPWHEALRNVIYLQFLALESGRHAVADLVEFPAEKAERTMVILISELEAYRFLCRQFPDEEDVYHQRIVMRWPEYEGVVPNLIRMVDGQSRAEKSRQAVEGAKTISAISLWDPAWRLVPELQRRYQAAMAACSASSPSPQSVT